MVKHIVFFRLPAHVDGDDREALARECVQRLEALNGQIPSLRHLEAGVDISRSEASWDVALYSTFADREGLEEYRVHPKHQEVVAWIKENTADRCVVDYED